MTIDHDFVPDFEKLTADDKTAIWEIVRKTYAKWDDWEGYGEAHDWMFGGMATMLLMARAQEGDDDKT